MAPGMSAAKVKALYEAGSYEEVPLDNMRRTIAARLVEAKQTVPHFYLTADVLIDRLNEVREEANAAAPKDADGNPAFKLSRQRFRHQGAGPGAAARAGRQCRVGGGPHPALPLVRHRRRGGARRRPDHAGDPRRRAANR